MTNLFYYIPKTDLEVNLGILPSKSDVVTAKFRAGAFAYYGTMATLC